MLYLYSILSYYLFYNTASALFLPVLELQNHCKYVFVIVQYPTETLTVLFTPVFFSHCFLSYQCEKDAQSIALFNYFHS